MRHRGGALRRIGDRRVERHAEPELVPLRGVAPDHRHDPGGGDGDAARVDARRLAQEAGVPILPGSEKPLQPLEVQYVGAYAQDVWQMKSNFSLTYGIRFDVPVFGDTGYQNAVADAMTTVFKQLAVPAKKQ